MDSFLADNRTYQNLVSTEHQGDVQANFMKSVEKYYNAYLYFHNLRNRSDFEIIDYLDFLNMHSYPRDEFLRVLVKFPNFTIPGKEWFSLSALQDLDLILRRQIFHTKHHKLLLNLIRRGYNSIIRECIQYGAECHRNDWQILRLLIQYGHRDLVKSLATARNVKILHHLPIRLVAKYGHLEIMKDLVILGGDVRSEDDDCLDWAVDNGDWEMMIYLETQGCVYNKYHLKLASENGNLEIVKYLIEVKNLNTVINLRYCVENGHTEVLKYLLDHGGRVINQLLYYGIEHLEIIKILILHGADINCYGGIVLTRSIEHQQYDVTEYLLNSGVIINNDSIKWAALWGNLDLIKRLIPQGFNNDALCVAARSGQLQIVKYLLRLSDEYNLDVLHTALGYAAKSKHLEVVKYIVDRYENILPLSREILNQAIKSGDPMMVKYIFQQQEWKDLSEYRSNAINVGNLEIIKILYPDKMQELPSEIFKSYFTESEVKSSHMEICWYLSDLKFDQEIEYLSIIRYAWTRKIKLHRDCINDALKFPRVKEFFNL